jgi:heme oxygenase (biliverdin-IX-beta and delta-forming)
MGMSMSVRAALRAATTPQHEIVDAIYGRYDLSDRNSYGEFLSAHGRVLPAIESALRQSSALPRFELRTALLENDLAALGRSLPPPLCFAGPQSHAAALGMLYVIEGSRLGGALLARRVPTDLPCTYLSAIHGPGQWRAFGEMLDRACEGPTWLHDAIVAANRTFDLYAEAANAG